MVVIPVAFFVFSVAKDVRNGDLLAEGSGLREEP
jgi:hypothetical protein